MLIYTLLIIALVLGGALFLRWLFKQPRRTQLRWLLYVLAGVILALALTGRIHWLGAVFAFLILVAKKLFIWARFIPFLRPAIALIAGVFKWFARAQDGNANRDAPASNDATMSRAEALEILDLNDDPTREEIIAAHKRLMQKMHPDRGGSDYLAKKINRAKDRLLGDIRQ